MIRGNFLCLDLIQGACTLVSRRPSPRNKNSPFPPMTLMTSQSLPQALLVAL